VNPHGLDDPDHYTSAYDLTMLGRELIRQPALATIVREKSYQPAWDGPGRLERQPAWSTPTQGRWASRSATRTA
jgi:D-alanyl-D-alanine carboxypeptidase